jgi:hypothetical protein
MGDPLLSAALIVRDEAEEIGGCLAALAGLVDEVVVYDTGSSDETVHRARAAGARVIDGFWDGDMARARCDAAAAANGQWVLVLDTDERVQGDPEALRAMLSAERPADAFTVLVRGVDADGVGGAYVHWATRVVRRGVVTWAGRVAERPVMVTSAVPDGEAGLVVESTPRTETMPSHVLSIEHHGFGDPEALRRKGERGAALAEAELQALLRLRPHDAEGIAAALLHLGRSLITAGRLQDAVDTFEMLRELAPGTQQWREATDFLARLLLGDGHDEAVVLLSDQLREAGADARYCDWLRAQALAQLGSPAEALELVRAIDELVDPAGRRYDVGQVLEVHALLAALLGHREEALSALVRAMAHHGRVAGRGPMLLELWTAGEGTPGELAAQLRRHGTGHLPALARELRAAGGGGPDIALALDL